MSITIRQLRNLVTAVLGLLLLGTAPASAQLVWPEDSPVPEEFDWVRLPSDEWLKGEVKAMYDDELEFESDELDTLVLDWNDIKELRSAQVLQVRATGDRIATGQVVLDDGQIGVVGESARFPQDEIISITAGEPREINYWAARVSAGATMREGNSDQRDFSARARVLRRTVTGRIGIDYIGTYSETDNVETDNNHRVNANWDRFLTDRFFLRPIFAEYFRDPFQNIAHRWTVGTGFGYQIIDTSETSWEVFAGPAYQYTQFEDVEPGEDGTEDSFAAVAGTKFDHELTDWIDVFYDYRFQVTSSRNGKYNHHMTGGLEIELTDQLDLEFSIVWDRIEDPQPDEDGVIPEKDDWRYIVGLGWEF
ncbi:MAG: DUF481 domain-containing protein [Gammaproteobacteria bacterium]